ncbi:MAG: damage-control phosphatase ARMT1 family protein [Candidatus Hecatellaceae archaeon]|nr:MAG: hypothetical protein DRO43_00830 [Candidatus Hecatellales archaeon]
MEAVGLKVAAECLPCLFERGYRETTYLTKNEKLRIEALRKVLEMMAEEFSWEAYPAKLGTLRDRIIKDFFGGRDPYAEMKKRSNRLALKLLPEAESFVSKAESPYEKFRRACLVAARANALEFDVKGYGFHLEDFKLSLGSRALTPDHTRKAYRLVKNGGLVFYLADNAGEIVLDRVLVEVLKEFKAEVVLVVKGGPVLNDATMEDVKASGIGEIVDRVETIGDTVGFIWDEAPPHLKSRLPEAKLTVAKGMGNYEALTELEGGNLGINVFFLLRAKCNPIARSIKIERGALAALLKTL